MSYLLSVMRLAGRGSEDPARRLRRQAYSFWIWRRLASAVLHGLSSYLPAPISPLRCRGRRCPSPVSSPALVARRKSGEYALAGVETIQVNSICDEVIAPRSGSRPQVAEAAARHRGGLLPPSWA